MASRALDKLINTLHRRFSESNFLLCKQTVLYRCCTMKWTREQKGCGTCAAVICSLSLGDNDAKHIDSDIFQRTHNKTQKHMKTHTHTVEYSEIYVKDVKNIVPKYVMKGYLFTKVTLVLIARQFFCCVNWWLCCVFSVFNFSLSLSISSGTDRLTARIAFR